MRARLVVASLALNSYCLLLVVVGNLCLARGLTVAHTFAMIGAVGDNSVACNRVVSNQQLTMARRPAPSFARKAAGRLLVALAVVARGAYSLVDYNAFGPSIGLIVDLA